MIKRKGLDKSKLEMKDIDMDMELYKTNKDKFTEELDKQIRNKYKIDKNTSVSKIRDVYA